MTVFRLRLADLTANDSVIDTLFGLRLALYLAWSDIKARYKRSVFGPFWLVLATAIGAAGLGYIWSILFKQDKAVFIPSLTVGLVIWQLISNCIIQAPSTFVRHSVTIKNTNILPFMYPLHMVLQNFLVFLHNAVVILLVFLIYPPLVNMNTLLIIPGLLLFLGNIFWMSVVIAIVGTRFRDVEPAITSIMSILFFLSPVVYRPEQLGMKADIMWLNPFTYFIAIIRDPLQGFCPSLFVYAMCCAFLAFGYLLTTALLKHYRHRIPFWL